MGRVYEPGSAEWHARVDSLLAAEAEQQPTWWWLSFADPNLPPGTQFLGACIVRSGGMVRAIAIAHALGINPGGEVAGWELPANAAEKIPADWLHRLLSKEEAEAGPPS